MYHHLDNDQRTNQALKAIKQNDGYLGQLNSAIRSHLLNRGWATVEVSPLTGLDVQWTLTAEGKKRIRQLNAEARYRAKNKSRIVRNARAPEDAPVPLTVDVLDALKSIRTDGHPNTTRLDILARIQRVGSHAAKTVKDTNGQLVLVYGSLAECKDGVWTLTDAGRRVEAGHIRKSDCAQFTGKVR